MDILSYMTAFGLATGAGGRASMVLFALGLFHHTEYFTLSEQFLWVGTIPVLFVLGVLTVVEILADMHPEISELNDVAQYLPALLAGFVAFASVTGDVDSSLLHLVASGVLGGVTATTTRYVRNQVSDVTRLADPTDTSRPFTSMAETGLVAGLMATSFFIPILVAIFLASIVSGVIYWRYRKRNKGVLEGSSAI